MIQASATSSNFDSSVKRPALPNSSPNNLQNNLQNSMADTVDDTRAKELLLSRVIELLLLFVLCGKFYYLFGFTGHLKPVAPQAVIALKDLVLVALGAVALYFGRSQLFAKEFIRFWLGFGLLTLVSLIHLSFAKSLHETLWHYWRNVLLILIFFPPVVLWMRRQQLQLSRLMSWCLALQLLGVAVQYFLRRETMLDGQRPLGFVGDPIILSATCFACLPYLLQLSRAWWVYLVVFLSGVTINMAASVTSFFSFGVAGIVLTYFILQLPFRQVFQLKNLLAIIVFLAGFAVPFQGVEDGLAARVWSVVRVQADKYFHVGLGSGPIKNVEAMMQGRVASNQRTFDQCSISADSVEPYLRCFFGNYTSPGYVRVDSNLSSMMNNWGVLGLAIFYGCSFWVLLMAFRMFMADKSQIELLVHAYCIVQILILGFFNSIIYKFPLNLIMVFSGAAIFLAYKRKANWL